MSKFQLKTAGGKVYNFNDTDEIHRGGEGRILSMRKNADMVAKIYHPNITPLSKGQFDFLSQLDADLFVVPLELLFDDKMQIVGFTMQYIDNNYFPLISLFSKNFCIRNSISSDTKRVIAENLIRAVHYAHTKQVVVGDLNQYNVLVHPCGSIRLIDVDSYQTPSHSHSGIMLDEIRDYLYNAKVNEESDFFALSVLVFYAFTYAHPFKGVHSVYKTIAERMVQRLPIFCDSPQLVKPKCYEPITEAALQLQYEKLYIEGLRFALSLDGLQAKASVAKAVATTVVSEKELTIKPIMEDVEILDINFEKRRGYIETATSFFVFDTSNKGWLNQIAEVKKADFQRIYVSQSYIFGKRDEQLFLVRSKTENIEITNFRFPAESIIYQLGDILLAVGYDLMYKLYLSDVINNSLRNERIEVFSRGFKAFTGLVQNAGGVNRIFYNTGKNIATVKADFNIKQLVQAENVGIIQYVEKKKIQTKYFKIKGLNLELSQHTIEEISDFGFMPQGDGEGFIFEPNDNKISMIHTSDFKTVSQIDCKLVSTQSKLQHTNAGIILWENKNAYLLNKQTN